MHRQQLKIFLLDDDEIAFVMTEGMLAKIGSAQFSLDWGQRYEDAVAALERGGYDLFLVDYHLDDEKTGLQFIEYAQQRGCQTPLVLLTADENDEVDVRVMKAGAADFLVKGQITPRLLDRSMRYAIEHTRALHRLAEAQRENQRLSEAKTEQLLSAVSFILIGLDDAGRIIRWNDIAGRMFGLSAEQVRGISLTAAALPTQLHDLLDNAARTFAGGDVHQEEIRLTAVDGSQRSVMFTVTPVDQAWISRGTLILGQDVTERRQMELQLLQAQKLEAIGQLAAGIAHEINTPTQYVGDNVQFLQESFGDLVRAVSHCRQPQLVGAGAVVDAPEVAAIVDDLDYLLEEIPRALDQSLEGIHRISTIVRAMKDFSHPGVEEKAVVDLNRCLRSTITIARNEWKYVAQLVEDLDPELPAVKCHPGDLNQVFLNLIVNAAHAIGEAVAGDPTAQGTITVQSRLAGEQVEVRISDTGHGIPQSIQAKIFDPFFTTKPVGRGTGQGLAIARSIIVQKHGGSISFETIAGRGTTFTVRLPLGH